jgi:pectate lyase
VQAAGVVGLAVIVVLAVVLLDTGADRTSSPPTSATTAQAPTAGAPAGPEGFGARTTGGAGGPTVWVTTLANGGAGSLRTAVATPGPRVVRFAVSGTIALEQRISVASDVTVDGVGADVTLTGRGLQVNGAHNVIIRNLRITHVRGDAEDAIQIVNGAHDVWIDHNDLSDGEDGLVDVTRGSTDVTISWNHFSNHDKVMLLDRQLDSGEASTGYRITLHHNFFDFTDERHPLAKNTLVHAYNNVVRGFTLFGMQAMADGRLWAQSNVFEPVPNSNRRQGVRPSQDENHGWVRADGNLLLGSATVEEYGREQVTMPAGYSVAVEPATVDLQTRVIAGAGANRNATRGGTGTGSGQGTSGGGAGAGGSSAGGGAGATSDPTPDVGGRTSTGSRTIVADPSTDGYWIAYADGRVDASGGAAHHGSLVGMPLNRPIVGMASTPTGAGYWLVADDGGIFSFGDASFHGSTGAMRLNRPIVGMASTPTGAGYWLVADDGGIFAFANASFHGSTGAMQLNGPVVGMAATAGGIGYWLVADGGGAFPFGDAE